MVKTVSIDFWNTLVIGETGGIKRHQVRLDALRDLAGGYDQTITEESVAKAKKQVSNEFDEIWFGQQKTLTSLDLVTRIVEILEIPAKKGEIEATAEAFMESLWVGPPAPAEGVIDAIHELNKEYRLAIISDTMFSPGRVLRKYLDDLGVLDAFEVTVFSDETGYSKPDKRAFKHVMDKTGARPQECVHIGDIQPTDIEGAQSVDWKGILYTGISDKYRADSTADKIVDSWNEVVNTINLWHR